LEQANNLTVTQWIERTQDFVDLHQIDNAVDVLNALYLDNLRMDAALYSPLLNYYNNRQEHKMVSKLHEQMQLHCVKWYDINPECKSIINGTQLAMQTIEATSTYHVDHHTDYTSSVQDIDTSFATASSASTSTNSVAADQKSEYHASVLF